MKVLFIAIDGRRDDFLLAPSIIKTHLLEDAFLRDNFEIDIYYHTRILPEEHLSVCNNIYEQVVLIDPDIVAFSTYVWNFSAVEYISNKIKSNLNKTIIVGGPEIQQEDIKQGRFDALCSDFLIFGEGEIPFEYILKYLCNITQIDEIPRTAYRINEKWIINNLSSPYLVDLSTPQSAYLSGNVDERILRRDNITALIETQRGCNFKCAYCLYHKNYTSIRYRPYELVVAEIEYLYNLGVRNIRIADANFFSDKDYAISIIEQLIQLNINVSLTAEVIPISISKEIMYTLKNYVDLGNSVTLGVGLQSININSLKSIRRVISLSSFETSYNYLLDSGVTIKTDIILGLPYETLETYEDLINFVVEKSRVGTNFLAMALLRILPGTDLVQIAQAEGIQIDINDNEHFIYQTRHMPLHDLIECLYYNAAVSRILHTAPPMGSILREAYFNTKDILNISNIGLLKELIVYMKSIINLSYSNQYEEYRLLRYDYPHIRNCFLKIEDNIILDFLNNRLK